MSTTNSANAADAKSPQTRLTAPSTNMADNTEQKCNRRDTLQAYVAFRVVFFFVLFKKRKTNPPLMSVASVFRVHFVLQTLGAFPAKQDDLCPSKCQLWSCDAAKRWHLPIFFLSGFVCKPTPKKTRSLSCIPWELFVKYVEGLSDDDILSEAGNDQTFACLRTTSPVSGKFAMANMLPHASLETF